MVSNLKKPKCNLVNLDSRKKTLNVSLKMKYFSEKLKVPLGHHSYSKFFFFFEPADE